MQSLGVSNIKAPIQHFGDCSVRCTVTLLQPVSRILGPSSHVVPRNDASQVCAHGVEAVLLDGVVLLDDQVGGISL